MYKEENKKIVTTESTTERYQKSSFGANSKLAEQYFARLLALLGDREVAEFQIYKDGKLVDFVKARKVAILYYIEPEDAFRSDVVTVRKRAKKLIKLNPDAEYVVDFYKEKKGIAEKLKVNRNLKED